MILGFAHPCLVVPDLETARRFYEQMFGFVVCGREGWKDNADIDRAIGLEGSASTGYMLRGHNCYLELFQYSAPAGSGPHPSTLAAHEPGIRHLSFYVDDCKAEYDRFLKLGGTAMGGPVGSDEDGWCVYARDPFGNIIELAQIMRGEESPTTLPGLDRLGDYSGS